MDGFCDVSRDIERTYDFKARLALEHLILRNEYSKSKPLVKDKDGEPSYGYLVQ